MKKLLIICVLLFMVFWMACRQQNHQLTNTEKVKLYQLMHVKQTDSVVKQLKSLIEKNAPAAQLQNAFKKARLAYKHTEFLAEYYTPLTAKSINGAPIPSMDDNDQHRIDQPMGFQVIEPYLFPKYLPAQKKELLKQVDMLLSNINRLKLMTNDQELADAQIFDALRLETFRIITQGITGFDAPIAQNSISEAAASLTALQDVTAVYQPENKAVSKRLKLLFQQSKAYLLQHPDFNTFNRVTFIKQFANPLSATLLQVSNNLGIAKLQDLRALKVNASTLFDPSIFNADYYTSGTDAQNNPEKTALGKRLFYDPILSGTGKRACVNCHQPEKAFTDGLAKSESIDGKTNIRRNTPTIINAGLQPALFYDNRVAYLEDQATDVINNKDEMHGSLPAAINRLKVNKIYTALFKNAFPKDAAAVSDYHLRNALGSYIRSLTRLNSPFDKYMRGDNNQLNAAEINGFNLFMGKGKCATCHFMPLFNGTVPPDFRIIETEVIGVPAKAGKLGIDADQGKYELRKLNLYKYAFRTPTLRNIALTTPYMHNGVFNTLEQVVDFYNKGGGLSAGADLPNLTLPFDQLNLTIKEQKHIVAFLNKLTDLK